MSSWETVSVHNCLESMEEDEDEERRWRGREGRQSWEEQSRKTKTACTDMGLGEITSQRAQRR